VVVVDSNVAENNLFFTTFRLRDLADVAKLNAEDAHGQLSVIEKADLYLQTLTKFLVWGFRLSGCAEFQGKEKWNQYRQSATTENLHALLLSLFAPFPDGAARDNHLLGWFVRVTSRKEGGSFVSLGDLRHTLVHFVYAMRVVTFEELTRNPNLNYKSERRAQILSMVRMR